MSAIDQAARTLADRVIDRYLQPNDELVVPHWLRGRDRDFWAAMAAYRTATTTTPENPMDTITYRVQLGTRAGRRAVYTVRRLRRDEVLRSTEEMAGALLGARVRELPLPAPGMDPDDVVTEITLTTRLRDRTKELVGR